ncbi:MAG: translocation/assembly module TamB domain-containing protein [Candidatus Marinimicrobia bacterium]|nr:translocation/assembly module TamB domain-containing protein [Candidatus Neomarinimicrobiota bacterium]
MKKRVAQWIGGVALAVAIILLYLIFFQTHLFSSSLLKNLNKHVLASYNVSIQGQLGGGLLAGKFSIHDLKLLLNQNSDTLFAADDISLSGIDYNWSSHELLIENVIISEYAFISQNLGSLTGSDSQSSFDLSLIIQQLQSKNGSIQLTFMDSLQTIEFPELNADLWHIDGLTGVSIASCVLFAPSITEDTLQLTGLLGVNSNGNINIEALELESTALNLNINSRITPDSVSVNFDGCRVSPSGFRELILPELYSDLEIYFDADLLITDDMVKVSGPGFAYLKNTTIPFDLTSFTRRKDGESISFTLGTELRNMSLSAHHNSKGVTSGKAEIFRLDVNPFLPINQLEVAEPIGTFMFSGANGNYSINSKLESIMINNLPFDSLNADIQYLSSGELLITNGVAIQADNHFKIEGKLSKKVLDLKGVLDLSEYSFLELFKIKNQYQGQIETQFNITGTLQHPRLSGEIRPRDLSYLDKLKLTGLGKIEVQVSADGLQGNFALQGNQGLLVGDSLQTYTILMNLSDNVYKIEDIHFQGLKNLISFKGQYDSQGFTVNKLKVIMDQHQLTLVDTVTIQRTADDHYQIPASVVVINKGGIAFQGSYDEASGLKIQTDFELIDLGEISEFINIKTPFEGLASGKAQITGMLNNPVIQANLLLKNGLTLGYPSDSASIDLTLKSNTIISNSIEAFQADGTLKLIGQLPWGYKMRGLEYQTAPQNFSMVLNNYRLKDLKFSKVAGIPISGRGSGSLSIRGTPIATKLDGEIEVVNAKFDTLSFSKAYTEFIYEGNLLTFDSLSMVSTWGYGRGTGYMPISLDMVAADRMAVADREMGLNFEFNLDEMPFLTSYISIIDAIKGDIIGNLTFTGPLSAPLRNGKVRGHNASLEVSVLGNPITDIHSEITLKDNTLIIDHFSGKMQASEASNLTTQGGIGWATAIIGDIIGVDVSTNYAGEVIAQGGLDITSFFHPIFDVRLKAEEVYYRSTDGQIEAIADAELHFTGQDTLDVTAVIPVKRAVYYSNFESEETYYESIGKLDSTLFRYSLDTQFPSDLLISNDQMEAEFEGELWLLDYGDGIMRFSGTLRAQAGGKFFYVGNELTIISGEILFNSIDFNPQLNMEAEIEINGERVELTLSGDLNEPELIINAENTQLTQSDVITYLTLNQKMVEISFDRQSALNPVQSYSVMLAEKQLSKIGRKYIGLDEVGIDLASDSTGGTRFQLGQRLSKNLKATYEGGLQPTDGQSDYDFGLEYQINRNVSVTGKVNQHGEVELNGRLKFTY